MAGGICKDVFPKTGPRYGSQLSAKGVRKAEVMQRILDAMTAYDIEEKSFLELLFGKKWMHCSGWKRQEVGDEFMLEFVKVTRKKNRLRGQQQRRTTLRKSLENDRKCLTHPRNFFQSRIVKKWAMKVIDLKIRRNVLMAEKKHRQIVKCMQRLAVLYSRLRGRPAPWACVN